MTDPLLQFRDRFPILKKTKYLVSHSLGAMPEATREALIEYADLWASRGVRAWGDRWWMMSIEVGDIIAPLIGAPPGSVVMLPNVTTAEAVVLSSFEYQPPRNRVVIVDGEFPSVRYIYDRLARPLGRRSSRCRTMPRASASTSSASLRQSTNGHRSFRSDTFFSSRRT